MKQKKAFALALAIFTLCSIALILPSWLTSRVTKAGEAPSSAFTSQKTPFFDASCLMSLLPFGSPQDTICGGLSDAVGTENDPAYVQDTEAQVCANWHISMNGTKAIDGCAEHMEGRHTGDYILLGPDARLMEYQITAIDTVQRQVAVTFVQPWIPDGTVQHPYLLLLYPGMCSDWSVTLTTSDASTNPLCTVTMPAFQQGQYVEVAGGNEEGEFLVQTIDLPGKSIIIG